MKFVEVVKMSFLGPFERVNSTLRYCIIFSVNTLESIWCLVLRYAILNTLMVLSFMISTDLLNY